MVAHVCLLLLLLLLPSLLLQEVPDDYSVARLLECIKVAHGRELEEAKNARRMLNEAQLRSLSLDQLLEMQENISLIIKVRAKDERGGGREGGRKEGRVGGRSGAVMWYDSSSHFFGPSSASLSLFLWVKGEEDTGERVLGVPGPCQEYGPGALWPQVLL